MATPEPKAPAAAPGKRVEVTLKKATGPGDDKVHTWPHLVRNEFLCAIVVTLFLTIWAVTVGTNMARATPLLGHEGPFGELVGVNARYDARAFLVGGRLVGAATLLRFYVLHCVFIPIAAAILMIVHFWRVRKDGGISGPL